MASVCSLCTASANMLVYNWLKGEIHLATPTSFCSLGGFPSDLFLSCGEVKAPCWPWFPLPNRCWCYFILQMRHFMNYHENKELLQLGEVEMERKGGRARNDFADKSSTLLNLCWHGKKPNIRKVMLQFFTVTLPFSFCFRYFKIPTSTLSSLKESLWKLSVLFKDVYNIIFVFGLEKYLLGGKERGI